jgi:prevent-host-death family protein
MSLQLEMEYQMEKTIGIRELKASISRVINAVRRGESTIITYHGKPLARIVPFEPAGKTELEILQSSPSIDWDGQMIREIQPAGYNTSNGQVSDVVTRLRE